jgi:hypothetical protein
LGVEKMAIRFFGDSRLDESSIVLYFEKSKVITDYTECGIYVASKFRSLEEPVVCNLYELIMSLPLEEEVIAENNGIANFFTETNIKTVGDLVKYFIFGAMLRTLV